MEFKDVRVLGGGALLNPINISAVACAIELFGCEAKNVKRESPNAITPAERLDDSIVMIGIGGTYFPESNKFDYVGATAWHKVAPPHLALMRKAVRDLGLVTGPYHKAFDAVAREVLVPLAVHLGYPFLGEVSVGEDEIAEAVNFCNKVKLLNEEYSRESAFWWAVGICRKSLRKTYDNALAKLAPELRKYHLVEAIQKELGRLVEAKEP